MRFCESAPVQISVGTFSLRMDVLGGMEILHTSDEFDEMFGVQSPTTLRSFADILAFVHVDDCELLADTIQEAAAQLKPAMWQGRLTARDDTKSVQIKLSPPQHEDFGGIWTGVLVDLTDVKALQDRFESVLNAAQAYTWRRDMRLGLSQFGERWAKFAHHDNGKNSLTNDDWLALVHPEDAPVVRAQVASLERGTVEHQVLVYRRKLADGSWVWLRVHAGVSERDQNGAPCALSGVSFDITAETEQRRRLSDEKAALSSELFDAKTALERTAYELTENIPVGTYTMLLNPGEELARFGFMSRRFLEITGIDAEQARANPIVGFSCVHPEDYDDWLQKNVHAFVCKLHFREEVRLLVNEQVRWVLAESIPRQRNDGVWVWEGVIQDITSQKIAEQALRRAHSDLMAMATSQARVKEREAILKDIHDGFGNQLAIGKLRLRRGVISAEKAVDIIDDCLDDLRLLFDSLDAEGESMWSMLAVLADRIGGRANALGVNTQWNIEAALEIALPTRSTLQVGRIVQEAISNALRHSGASTILVNVAIDNERRIIEIKDDGCGFDINQVLQGRGLSSMRARAEKIGSRLEIATCDFGTSVTVELPSF